MKYDKPYYVGGKESNYKNYRAKKFKGLAKDISRLQGVKKKDRILDFGAATGGLVSELKKRGFKNVVGTDISVWAVEVGRQQYRLSCEELQHYNINLINIGFDWIIYLDTLEHFDLDELDRHLELLKQYPPKKGLIVRIPVCGIEGEHYILAVSRNDPTHLICKTKNWWIDKFKRAGFDNVWFLGSENIYDSEGVLCAMLTKD